MFGGRIPLVTRRLSRRLPLLGAALVGGAALVASVASAPAAAAAPHLRSLTLYAAPTGTGPACVRSRPCSVPVAQKWVRALIRHQREDIVVSLSPGTYRLAAPLVLDARDSGSNGHTVRWQGGPGTVFSGGRPVTRWTPVAGKAGMWSAPAPRDLGNTRQLYVNGVRAQRARGPVPVTLTRTATGYTASAATLAGWHDVSDMEFVYTSGEALWNIQRDGLGQWTEPRCPIASVSGTEITMAQPCWDNSNKRVQFPDIPGRTVSMVGPGSLTDNGRPTYLENAFELLDQPGEWYLDRTAHRVYYRPRPGENLAQADVEAPVLQTLVEEKGTPDSPVHDIAFDGIQFSYATWLGPSSDEGFSEIQAGYQITGPNGWATEGLCQYVQGGTCPFGAWTQEPGNVTVAYGHDVSFSGDVFAHLGAAGLQLGDGTQNATVKGNIVTDTSGNGIEIGNVDKAQSGDPADITRDVTVADNHLYDLPREFHGGVAIVNGYSQRDLITHNQINHVAYSGVSMGWGGWPDKIGDPPTPNFSHDNVVSDNLIYDYMLMLDDGGGVYTQGITGTSLETGEKVTGNVIHDQAGLGKNVYTDNGDTYETIKGNVLYNAAYANVASRHTDYRDDLGNNDPTLIEDNYWQTGDPDSDNAGLVTKGNHLLSNPGAAPASIVDNAGLEPAYRGLLQKQVGGVSVPDSPQRVGSFAADGSVYVAWSATIGNNGAPVDSYTATVTGGGQTRSTTITAADFHRLGYAVVDGLADGTAYTATVTAHNGAGDSEVSLPAAPVTPHALAGAAAKASTSLKARAGIDAVGLQWTPPADTGDTPVIGYRITVSDGRTILATGRDALVTQPTAKTMIRVVDGLEPGTKYTFTIAAITADGPGAPASVSATVNNACDGAKLTTTPSAVLSGPGRTVPVETTLTNGCTTPMTGVQLALTAPAGYQVSPAAPVAAADLAPGKSESVTWQVSVPTDAVPAATLAARAAFVADDGRKEAVTAESTIDVPADSLAALFDNVGITDDTDTGPGNIDGSGSSLSAQALAAQNVTPGSSVSHGGLQFTWPDVAAGRPDNVVAGGQAIDVHASADTLGFLVAATYGPVSGTGHVVYTDGSSQDYTLTAPDWYSSSGGGDPVISMTYRNRAGNVQQTHAVTVSYAAVPIDPAKTLATVVLPDVSHGVTPSTPAMHIFAVATSEGAVR
jgi:NPCBM-associated, NEW3 domain of alpha-galactosidase/Fibronectin type III domain/Right handed beta helix region